MYFTVRTVAKIAYGVNSQKRNPKKFKKRLLRQLHFCHLMSSVILSVSVVKAVSDQLTRILITPAAAHPGDGGAG